MQHPSIKVGILSSPAIRFQLNGGFRVNGGNDILTGLYTIERKEGKALLKNDSIQREVGLPFLLEPVKVKNSFDLPDVVIGIEFHWERKESQRFTGDLQIIAEGEGLTAVNVLPLEDYLLSVISSEMSSTSSPELLKAHAVISRSWLLAQKEKAAGIKDAGYTSVIETADTFIRWWDREDHEYFDVCADDHCQRYQGITRASTSFVRDAIRETFGEVLTYGGKTCDARFSKCCGGIAEKFENTWEPVVHPYLTRVVDSASEKNDIDLTREDQAKQWITTSPPESFCNTTDKEILSQVLNDYDQETHDFYRWQVSYTQDELSALAKERIKIDFGRIEELIPVERGVSGRLMRLKVVGSKRTVTIGKELVIRKAFSKSHLYSSGFVVDKKKNEHGETVFVFRGAGWGHGVGLCQIGAAVMGAKGYGYKEILSHYFPGADLVKQY